MSRGDNYIWLGVYDELLVNDSMVKAINMCSDTTMPIEARTFHLRNYRMCFAQNKTLICKTSENDFILLKLYLITKLQFMELLTRYYKFEEKVSSSGEKIFSLLMKPDCQVDLSEFSTDFYNMIYCIGTKDDISIFSISSSVAPNPSSLDSAYLKNIFMWLKESFAVQYSEYLLMYYVYLLEQNATMISGTQIFFETDMATPDYESKAISASKSDTLNEVMYIFDLNYTPTFDEDTGEFIWTHNESEWQAARDSHLKLEEIEIKKTLSLNHGALMSIAREVSTPPLKQDDEELTQEKVSTFLKEMEMLL